ncbi:MAG: TonB-dependent receptor plug domain-containing protein, partial [Bacteroidota bacterium]
MASGQSGTDTTGRSRGLHPQPAIERPADSSARQLERVIVTGQSKVRAAREQPQAVTVINTRAYYNRPEGAVDLVNQAAGVKVRQGGGLGSYADYYINGLSGRQVKFFLDGIPLDYLGAGLNLNILPVNSIDRIEIYKGVVPVRLGTDALGGAIDIITRRSTPDYLDLSYAVSSFHTSRVSLNGKGSLGSKFYLEATGFYNYSKNNYKVNVTVPNAYGNPEP